MAGRRFSNGDCSSVGRAPDCDSGRRGFESHQSPQILVTSYKSQVTSDNTKSSPVSRLNHVADYFLSNLVTYHFSLVTEFMGR